QTTREVLEIPLVPVQVTEHQYLARTCPVCCKRQVPPVDLAGGVLGPHYRLGVGLVRLIVTLRAERRLSFAQVRWYLATFHQLHVSVGELVGVVQQVAQRARATVTSVRQTIAASPVVGADETGWREHGRNGYVWTFSTPTACYFLRRGRGKEVLDEVL